MIILNNYEFIVDKRTSKNGKDYFGLYIVVDNHEELVCFINKNFYEFLSHLSK